MQSRGKLCRGASRFTPLLVIVPIHFRRHRAERVYPLARYTAAASIIPNYNNKCKSRITTRKPDNKVSPGARSCHSRTNATGTWYRHSFRFLVPETVTSMMVDESTITIITNKLNRAQATVSFFLFLQCMPHSIKNTCFNIATSKNWIMQVTTMRL